jgi:hypothetical protein
MRAVWMWLAGVFRLSGSFLLEYFDWLGISHWNDWLDLSYWNILTVWIIRAGIFLLFGQFVLEYFD